MPDVNAAMSTTIEEGRGCIAALDQSGGSTPDALETYGLGRDAYANEHEMFERIHDMRVRILTSPAFRSDKVIGVILFDKTMDGFIDGEPVPSFLRRQGIVPFVKIDQGLAAETDGVRLMKAFAPDALLERAVQHSVFGTKMRSMIHGANPDGIAAVVRQQVELAEHIADYGLLPIVEPEVSMRSRERAACDHMLLAALMGALDAMHEDHQIILKLSLPVEPNLFAPLVEHPRVLRVVALSGGYSRREACHALAQNRGVIASFSRALLEDLRHTMSDEVFHQTIAQATDEIHRASFAKAPAAHVGSQPDLR